MLVLAMLWQTRYQTGKDPEKGTTCWMPWPIATDRAAMKRRPVNAGIGRNRFCLATMNVPTLDVLLLLYKGTD